MTIKIYHPPFLQLHAERLADTLNTLGHTATLTREVNSEDDTLYIIYCAFQINDPPKNYIVYQCEQWGSHWFNEHYWNIINGAKAVWEFGENNISKYPPMLQSIVSCVPPGLINGETSVKNIDVLFYGELNKRRLDLINGIRAQNIHITYKQNVYGAQMKAILSRTKVVLNIHYYESGHLEAFRINEALCCGCQVVSERNSTAYYPEKYKEIVSFGTNKGELAFAIKKALATPVKVSVDCLDNLEFVREAMEKISIALE